MSDAEPPAGTTGNFYSTHHEGTIARIELNRPETRNAQHRTLLVELGDAFHRAESDDTGSRRHSEWGRHDVLLGPRHGIKRAP